MLAVIATLAAANQVGAREPRIPAMAHRRISRNPKGWVPSSRSSASSTFVRYRKFFAGIFADFVNPFFAAQFSQRTPLLGLTTSYTYARKKSTEQVFPPLDNFVRRHIGSSDVHIKEMLDSLKLPSLDALVEKTLPANILHAPNLEDLQDGRGENELLQELKEKVKKNKMLRSFIGTGYYGTVVPPVIQRNILENPGWYTPYTPYQAEIAQGRLESLLNFQTLITDLTGLPVANASLLDEATAAAEAMNMCFAAAKHKSNKFFVSSDCHPQTLALLKTRARPLGMELIVGDPATFDFAKNQVSTISFHSVDQIKS